MEFLFAATLSAPSRRRRPQRLLASLGSCAPVLHRERPPLVVAPATTNLEVPWRKALLPESESTNQIARGGIAWLNVRFDTMQPVDAEHLPQHGPQASAHMAVPTVGHEGVVAKVCRLECTPNDLTDVDDTRQVVFTCSNPVSNVRGSSHSRKIALERFDCTRWGYQALDEGHDSWKQPPEIPPGVFWMVLRESDSCECVWLTARRFQPRRLIIARPPAAGGSRSEADWVAREPLPRTKLGRLGCRRACASWLSGFVVAQLLDAPYCLLSES